MKRSLFFQGLAGPIAILEIISMGNHHRGFYILKKRISGDNGRVSVSRVTLLHVQRKTEGPHCGLRWRKAVGTRALGQQASCASSWGSASSSYGLVTTESISRNVQPRGAQVRPHRDSVFMKCPCFSKTFLYSFHCQKQLFR